MKVIVKTGAITIEKDGYDENLVRAMMEGILVKLPHQCSKCGSNKCKGKRNYTNPMIKRAIHTLNRNYILECDGFEERKLDDDCVEDSAEKTLAKYAASTYSVAEPTVESIIRATR